MNKDTEPDDTRQWHAYRDRTNNLSITCFHEFCLTKVEQDDGFLCVTDTHRLIILIEDEHFTAKFTVRTFTVV